MELVTQDTSSYQIPVEIPNLQFFHSASPFEMEMGGVLPEVTIAYHTYGTLNETRDNVIWVCHALTANSNVADWWDGIFGPGLLLDPEQYFIVCANFIGSCYGSTCSRSINPETGMAYGLDFPLVTVRDWVNGHARLWEHLGIRKIAFAIGGSCGGHQVLEMTKLYPEVVDKQILLVTSARESSWCIAIHEAGRMALLADTSFPENRDDAGAQGLEAARALGLLNYRTRQAYLLTQTDQDQRVEDFKAASYVRYQGVKLRRRFFAHCYFQLLKTLDTHHLGRGAESIEAVLQQMSTPSLILGIETDQLIPPDQQAFMHEHLPQSTFHVMASDFGHDGFLIETDQINQLALEWLGRP